jgi:hypothetical protein
VSQTPTRPWWLGGGKVQPDDTNIALPNLSVPVDGSLPSWVDADDEEVRVLAVCARPLCARYALHPLRTATAL